MVKKKKAQQINYCTFNIKIFQNQALPEWQVKEGIAIPYIVANHELPENSF